jgi:hypothetical protein
MAEAADSELGRFDGDRAGGRSIPSMAQKPVEQEVAQRFAELVGVGLTQHEAARAVGIGTRTGERLLTKPEIRQIVELTRTADNGDPTIRALLEATDEAGNPDWVQRVKGVGVELALAHLASLAGESEGRENLPAGCDRRLPAAAVRACTRYTEPGLARAGRAIPPPRAVRSTVADCGKSDSERPWL